MTFNILVYYLIGQIASQPPHAKDFTFLLYSHIQLTTPKSCPFHLATRVMICSPFSQLKHVQMTFCCLFRSICVCWTELPMPCHQDTLFSPGGPITAKVKGYSCTGRDRTEKKQVDETNMVIMLECGGLSSVDIHEACLSQLVSCLTTQVLSS